MRILLYLTTTIILHQLLAITHAEPRLAAVPRQDDSQLLGKEEQTHSPSFTRRKVQSSKRTFTRRRTVRKQRTTTRISIRRDSRYPFRPVQTHEGSATRLQPVMTQDDKIVQSASSAHSTSSVAYGTATDCSSPGRLRTVDQHLFMEHSGETLSFLSRLFPENLPRQRKAFESSDSAMTSEGRGMFPVTTISTKTRPDSNDSARTAKSLSPLRTKKIKTRPLTRSGRRPVTAALTTRTSEVSGESVMDHESLPNLCDTRYKITSTQPAASSVGRATNGAMRPVTDTSGAERTGSLSSLRKQRSHDKKRSRMHSRSTARTTSDTMRLVTAIAFPSSIKPLARPHKKRRKTSAVSTIRGVSSIAKVASEDKQDSTQDMMPEQSFPSCAARDDVSCKKYGASDDMHAASAASAAEEVESASPTYQRRREMSDARRASLLAHLPGTVSRDSSLKNLMDSRSSLPEDTSPTEQQSPLSPFKARTETPSSLVTVASTDSLDTTDTDHEDNSLHSVTYSSVTELPQTADRRIDWDALCNGNGLNESNLLLIVNSKELRVYDRVRANIYLGDLEKDSWHKISYYEAALNTNETGRGNSVFSARILLKIAQTRGKIFSNSAKKELKRALSMLSRNREYELKAQIYLCLSLYSKDSREQSLNLNKALRLLESATEKKQDSEKTNHLKAEIYLAKAELTSDPIEDNIITLKC